MSRQLNIRSDSAYRMATLLARRLDLTTTDVVVQALRELEKSTFRVPTLDEMTPEQRADFEAFDAAARDLSERLGSGIASDRDTLHDECGLPK